MAGVAQGCKVILLKKSLLESSSLVMDLGSPSTTAIANRLGFEELLTKPGIFPVLLGALFGHTAKGRTL